jgi:hypothetical protein
MTTMRPVWMISFALLAGCVYTEPRPDVDLSCPSTDGKPATADMAVAPPKCAAAKGLAGDNLLCVDFDKVTQLSDPALAGWSFTAVMSGTCTGWTVAGGKLQVTSFATLANGSCGFTLPALSASDYQKYSSFTLSVVQRVHIDESSGQTVQIMMGADAPMTRLVTQWTGKGARQTSVMAMAKADLPNGGTNAYQPLLKINSTSTAGGTFQGWLLESIAVNGSP